MGNICFIFIDIFVRFLRQCFLLISDDSFFRILLSSAAVPSSLPRILWKLPPCRTDECLARFYPKMLFIIPLLLQYLNEKQLRCLDWSKQKLARRAHFLSALLLARCLHVLFSLYACNLTLACTHVCKLGEWAIDSNTKKQKDST